MGFPWGSTQTISKGGSEVSITIPEKPEWPPENFPCNALNNQLQALNARLNSMEDMDAMDQCMSFIMSLKNIAGMTAIVPNGSLGAAVLLADPQIIAQIAQQIQKLLDLCPGEIYKLFSLNLSFNLNLSVEVGAGLSLPAIPQVEMMKLAAIAESKSMTFGTGGGC